MKVLGIVFALVAAGLALALGALLYAGATGTMSSFQEGCDVAPPLGEGLSPTVADSGADASGDVTRRIVAYALDPADLGAGRVEACGTVGDVSFTRSADDLVRVVFTVEQRGMRSERSVEATDVEALFAERDGVLSISASRGDTILSRWWPFAFRATSVDVRIEVPDGMPFDVEATTNVGDATLDGVTLRDVALVTDVGRVEVRRANVTGDLVARTDVGDVDVALAAIAGAVEARADVGKVTLALPEGAYDVRASADVGALDVSLADADVVDRDTEGPGESVHALTGDGARVPVVVSVDVGDVVVRDA